MKRSLLEGISLFASTMLISMILGYQIRRKSIKFSTLHSTYEETLKKMFPIDLDKKKLPSRHAGNSDSISEVYQLRKEYFTQVYSNIIDKNHPPKIIHVAGTKGKGSTVEYIASAIRSHKYARVGVFTSPHIHSARERVKVGLDLISKEAFIRLGNEALEQMGHKPWVVFFDLLLYVALRHFCEQKVDYIVLETGIGGRYDSTNIFDDPIAVAITSISLDHQAMLGSTIEEIAWQKAGIIKPGCHVFTPSIQKPSVLDVFRRECNEKGAILHEIPPFVGFLHANHYYNLPVPPYDVQIQNACLSTALLMHINVPAAGMKNFYWPCRMEPFWVHDGVQLIIDGCHNGDSVNMFLKRVQWNYVGAKTLIIFGAGVEKCLNDMLNEVLQYADHIVVTQSKHFRAMPEKQLAQAALAMNIHAEKLMIESMILEEKILMSTVDQRLKWAIDYARTQRSQGKEVVIAVCGSLFVAAEAREYLFRTQPSLFSANDWVREADNF